MANKFKVPTLPKINKETQKILDEMTKRRDDMGKELVELLNKYDCRLEVETEHKIRVIPNPPKEDNGNAEAKNSTK